ncbi:MAG: hypothetical protein ABMA14_24705 [Hyphomonadaceae bacterium]
MRLAAVLLFSLGLAAPAFAQQCDVSTPAGDIFRADARGRIPVVGWDVKRFEHLGQESEHFSRPALSLTFAFAFGSDDKLAGPVEATVSITSNSDRSAGAAPPIGAMRLRAKVDARPVFEWNATTVSGEATLADALREAWPRELVIEIVAPDGKVVGSAAYDVAARAAVETTVRSLPATCFR